MIEIRNDVPFPTRAVKVEPKYPIAELEVGESFWVPIAKASLYSHALRVSKATERKFVVRAEAEGSRVWRKA